MTATTCKRSNPYPVQIREFFFYEIITSIPQVAPLIAALATQMRPLTEKVSKPMLGMLQFEGPPNGYRPLHRLKDQSN